MSSTLLEKYFKIRRLKAWKFYGDEKPHLYHAILISLMREEREIRMSYSLREPLMRHSPRVAHKVALNRNLISSPISTTHLLGFLVRDCTTHLNVHVGREGGWCLWWGTGVWVRQISSVATEQKEGTDELTTEFSSAARNITRNHNSEDKTQISTINIPH